MEQLLKSEVISLVTVLASLVSVFGAFIIIYARQNAQAMKEYTSSITQSTAGNNLHYQQLTDKFVNTLEKQYESYNRVFITAIGNIEKLNDNIEAMNLSKDSFYSSFGEKLLTLAEQNAEIKRMLITIAQDVSLLGARNR